MNTFSRCVSFAFAGVLLFSGCAKYSPKSPLKKLATGVAPHTQEPVVAFGYHIFTPGDCKRYLDRDVIAYGYQPVQITLTNNTKHYFAFSTKNFSFPCVAVEEVAEKMHTNTVGRAVGYGVAGLFIWPFLIPAIVDGVGSDKANRKLDADFARKALYDQTLAPMSVANGLIFVPTAAFYPDFSFTVADMQTGEQYTLTSGKQYAHI